MFNTPVQSQYWSLSGNTTGTSDYFGTNNSNPIKIYTSGNEVARFLTTGELGLGTTSPSSWLHVKTSGTKESFKTDVPSGYDNYWRMYKGGTEYGQLVSFDAGNGFYMIAPKGNLRLASGNSGTSVPSFHIQGGSGSSAGNVLIGDYSAYSPGARLHIKGNGYSSLFKVEGAASSSVVADIRDDGQQF